MSTQTLWYGAGGETATTQTTCIEIINLNYINKVIIVKLLAVDYLILFNVVAISMHSQLYS